MRTTATLDGAVFADEAVNVTRIAGGRIIEVRGLSSEPERFDAWWTGSSARGRSESDR
jgi:hypothetical protein